MWTRGQMDPRRGVANAGRRWARFLRALDSRRAEFNPLDSSDRPDEAFESGWRLIVRRRALLVLALVALWGVGLHARLVYLQVVKHDEYLARAHDQQQDIIDIEATRGDVTDRDGRLLAYSVDAQLIAVRPRAVADPARTVAALCAALRDCTAGERRTLIEKFSRKRGYVPVRRARAVSPEQVARVAALELPGVAIEPDTRRYYPGGELAAHVLGFVSVDNKGLGGIEHAYNTRLTGRPGRAHVQVDALRNRVDMRVEREPVPGATIELTIDRQMQHIVERELRAGIEAHRAKGGTVIVMAPFTGEILAMASYPTFNPNTPASAKVDATTNPATQNAYEPGSTFKIVTACAAIEEGVVTAGEMIDTRPGWIKFAGRKPITEASGHNYGVLTFEEAIVKSSNVGAIKVGLRTGAERLTKYVHRFGFGEALAPDFMGQSRGIWNAAALNESGLASVSMGYQVSVTPLQMATAASAIANGGLLMEPRVVRAIVTNGRRDAVTPKVIRRAVTAETAATLRTMMEGVVDHGTATRAQLPGHLSAGKTGTAHKIDGRRYSDTDYNASFVGFVPSRSPAFTILVVIDTPRAGTHYGGTVAAPIYQKIAEALLPMAGVAPTVNPDPPVILRADRASLPTTRVRATVMPPAMVPAGGAAVMPDVRGLSAREAMRVLLGSGLRVRLDGNGFVGSQLPQPGAPIVPGTAGLLRLVRRVPDDPVEAHQ